MLTYLDNNATTRPLDQVIDAMARVEREVWGNASSVHRFGQAARREVELARASVADLIGARPRNVVFTSGGTEANNLALRGVLQTIAGESSDQSLVVTCPVEHVAVREPAEALQKRGVPVEWLSVDAAGRVDPEGLAATLREATAGDRAPVAIVVSVMWANNETGVLQPIREVAQVVARLKSELASDPSRSTKVVLHCDATQAAGKLPVNVGEESLEGLDLLTLSAHKFHGPKGVGALWVRQGVRLGSQQQGGPQERELRGGTEAVASIVGAGVAARAAADWLSGDEHTSVASAGDWRSSSAPTATTTLPGTLDGVAARDVSELGPLRDRLEQQALARIEAAQVNAGNAPRLWNTTNLALPRLEAEAVLIGLSERGVCGSAGAACSSGSLEPSPVLRAMGIPDVLAHGSIRLSLSRFTTDAEIDAAVDALEAVAARLSRALPV